VYVDLALHVHDTTGEELGEQHEAMFYTGAGIACQLIGYGVDPRTILSEIELKRAATNASRQKATAQ
jgi:hypothetical protein